MIQAFADLLSGGSRTFLGRMFLRFGFLSVCLFVACFQRPVLAAENDAAAPLRRVADHVMTHTTRRLIDRSTGETFESSAGVAPKPEISIESKFNAWFYQTWLLGDGIRRVAESLNEPRYRGYGEANLDFIFQHMGYFQRQHEGA